MRDERLEDREEIPSQIEGVPKPPTIVTRLHNFLEIPLPYKIGAALAIATPITLELAGNILKNDALREAAAIISVFEILTTVGTSLYFGSMWVGISLRNGTDQLFRINRDPIRFSDFFQ